MPARFLTPGKPPRPGGASAQRVLFCPSGRCGRGGMRSPGFPPGNADRQGRSDERARLTGSRVRYSAQGYRRASPLARERPARRMCGREPPHPAGRSPNHPSGPNRRARGTGASRSFASEPGPGGTREHPLRRLARSTPHPGRAPLAPLRPHGFVFPWRKSGFAAGWLGVSDPLRHGEGDHAKHGGGAQASDPDFEARRHGACPTTTLRVVPLPVPGRIGHTKPSGGEPGLAPWEDESVRPERGQGRPSGVRC